MCKFSNAEKWLGEVEGEDGREGGVTAVLRHASRHVKVRLSAVSRGVGRLEHAGSACAAPQLKLRASPQACKSRLGRHPAGGSNCNSLQPGPWCPSRSCLLPAPA